jgi:hypothetical protein
MPTTIDTNPAANLTINDANTADVITVSDGPAENGYQTTQVTMMRSKPFICQMPVPMP